jgi:hypothetical protein
MDNKIIISLVSLAVGWRLSQLTDFVKYRRQIARQKRHLLLNLRIEDIKVRLQEVCLSDERSIQIYALNGIEPSIVLPLNHFIFNKHYADTSIHLRASQRKSYELIHGYVEAINSSTRRIEELLHVATKNPSDKNTKKWPHTIFGLLKIMFHCRCRYNNN